MNLFVYGTLLVPRIWNAVTNSPDLTSVEAKLSGHRIARVRGGDFPAIAKSAQPDSIVPGRVFFDLPPQAMERLDRYEDRFYVRESVEVITQSQRIAADTYRIPEERASEILSEDPWTLDWFEENALDEYWARLFRS